MLCLLFLSLLSHLHQCEHNGNRVFVYSFHFFMHRTQNIPVLNTYFVNELVNIFF